VLPVLVGAEKSTLKLLEWTADRMERRMRLPFEFSIDTTGSLLPLADDPSVSPVCLLIDPSGRVRYSANGSDPRDGTTQFASLVRARLDGPPKIRTLRWPEPAPREKEPGPVAPDGPVVVRDDRTEVPLSSLFSPEITVVTFLQGNPRTERERLTSLGRYGRVASSVRLIYVYADTPGASAPQDTPPAVLVARAGADLFRRFGVAAGPRTFVIAKQRLLVSEDGVFPSSAAIRSALDQYFLLHGQPVRS
jgi:hypothetical protein